MDDKNSTVKRIGVLERKICDGEALLRKTNRANGAAWFFIAVGTLMTFYLGGVWVIIGIIAIAASVWYFVKMEQSRKEIEEGLRAYRGEKAELLAGLMVER